jgi:hypothetical protein
VNFVDVNLFLHQFKSRVIDTYIQDWHRIVDNSPVLDMYCVYKPVFVYEHYLDHIPKSLRTYITKLRLSVLPLRIQTGRYASQNTPRNERHCLLCNETDLEDEFHFVCKCTKYSTIRKKYIKPFYYNKPSVYKFHQLLNGNNTNELLMLAKYVKLALKARNTFLNNTL